MRLILIVAAALGITGCSTTFLAYEGRSDLIFEGRGGARTVVDGIDFWQHGDPPRTYQLIGYIKDKRKNGLIETLTKEGNVASKAREFGGDAVMVLEANQTIIGYSRSSFFTRGRYSSLSGGITIPIGTTEATFAVLKYVNFADANLAPSAAVQPATLPLSPAVPPSNVSPYAAPPSYAYAGPGTSYPPNTAVGGVFAYEAEKMARTHQCAPSQAAIQTGAQPGVEFYDVKCTTGKVLHASCGRAGCSETQ